MANKQNTLIGRPCIIDFACRWKTILPQFKDEEKAKYEKRDDWNKTGEIVSFNSEEHKVLVLRDDDGSTANYYLGEITVTGPAPDPQKEVVALLKEIRDLLKRD